MSPPPSDPRAFLRSLFEAAVAAADPKAVIRDCLPERPKGRTVVVGAGKGVAQLAGAFEQAWEGPIEGVVVTRYGHAAPCERIEVLEAAHPVPDEAGLRASGRLLAAVSGLSADDLVVALVCGGGSALLPAPAGILTLEDEIIVNKALLASGAPISAMNTIRKHVSRIKGGRLALAALPARVATLIVSDIPGDDPALVASGPTVPAATTRADALDAIRRHRIALPDHIVEHIANAACEAPQPGDPRFAGNSVRIVASARLSLEAAARAAEAQGVKAAILSDAIEGEAAEVGKVHAAIAREIAARDRPFSKPVVLLSGGETTVTLRNPGGKGGRNTAFLLSLALGIEGLAGATALAADTDGTDGTQDNAGAFCDGTTVRRLRDQGLSAADMLAADDAWSAFAATGDLLVTGPTGTNVNDFRAIVMRSF